MATYTDYTSLLPELNQQAVQAQQTATNYASAAALLPSKLKDAINEKLNYNRDIIEEQNKAMANYFAAPSAAREQYQGIFNPFTREKLVAQATSNAYAPYATLSDILKARQGDIASIIDAGTGAFNAQATQAQGAANAAQNSFGNILNMAQLLKPPAGSSKSLLEQMLEQQIIDMYFRKKNIPGAEPTESEPRYSPNRGEGAMSPARQWVYHQGEWMINQDSLSGNSSSDGFIPDQ